MYAKYITAFCYFDSVYQFIVSNTRTIPGTQSMGVSRESVTKVRLMTEGVMLDWIANGLADIPCELRLDKRYHGKMLMLSVSGENKSNASLEDGYADMFKGLNLTIETYYAAEKNICNILVP